MSVTSPSGFRTLPVRVALITTVVVALVYAVAAIAVLVLSRNTLVGDIDARLARQLATIQATPDVVSDVTNGQAGDLDNDGDATRFDTPLVVWLQGPGGASFQTDANTPLPQQYTTATGPLTATIGGTDMRLVGGPLTDAANAGWVTIAQSLNESANAVNSLLIAEILIAPLVLVIVFLGALLVGRRVAQPIEQARLAQLAFTADASHELRTPLTVIRAETSLGLQHDEDPSAMRATLERIRDESSVLGALVDDLLWLARFDSAPAAPPAEAVDLGALARATARRFSPIASQRGTQIAADISGVAAPVIKAPPEWIARVLSVLLDNAVRHTQAGAHIEVSVVTEGNRVRLAIEDDGPGIPEDQRAQILNRFHRLTDSHDGAGLGLAIADAIVAATGGQWDIGESALGGARMAVSWHRLTDAAYASPVVDTEDDDEPISSELEGAQNQHS